MDSHQLIVAATCSSTALVDFKSAQRWATRLLDRGHLLLHDGQRFCSGESRAAHILVNQQKDLGIDRQHTNKHRVSALLNRCDWKKRRPCEREPVKRL